MHPNHHFCLQLDVTQHNSTIERERFGLFAKSPMSVLIGPLQFRPGFSSGLTLVRVCTSKTCFAPCGWRSSATFTQQMRLLVQPMAHFILPPAIPVNLLRVASGVISHVHASNNVLYEARTPKMRFSLLPVLTVILFATGCNYKRPFEAAPGPIWQQQAEANLHDPYADFDAGPEIVGARPREFNKPRTEPTRGRAHPASQNSQGASWWPGSWFGG